jgi:RNA-binding protein YlmH
MDEVPPHPGHSVHQFTVIAPATVVGNLATMLMTLVLITQHAASLKEKAAAGTEQETLVVQEEERRLDIFLTRNRPDLSRAFLQRLIQEGYVLVNGAAGKASQRLRAGHLVMLAVPPQ